jgi:hypothetical protein
MSIPGLGRWSSIGPVTGTPLDRAKRGGQARSAVVTSGRASCSRHQAKWPSLPSVVKALLVATA